MFKSLHMHQQHYLLLCFFFVSLLLLESCTKDKGVVVTINPSFTITKSGNVAPVTISLSNTTTGADNYEWTFEGGSPAKSTEVSPSSISYSKAGTYTVTLLAKKGSESKTLSKTFTLTEPTTTLTRTLWKGAKITFTKADAGDPALASNQDRITENVWLTRGNNGGEIYNAKTETVSDKGVSPKDTKWAIGSIDGIDNLTFNVFRSAVGSPKNVVGKDLVLHLVSDDIYISVKFLSWSSGGKTGGKGGFSYERSSP